MQGRRSAQNRVADRPPAGTPAEDDPDADPESVARTICLRLLTVRARTRAELAEALQQRDVPEEAATRVLHRLAEVGLVDDRAFAESFASSRQRERGLAGREIARQLRDKGVDDEVIGDATGQIDAESERQRARSLVVRRQRSMSRLEPAVQTRRLVGMLARKGYSPSMAFQIVGEVLGELAADLAATDDAWLA